MCCALTYSYVVNGEYYAAEQSIRASNERHADALAAQWKGRSVVVRYSPSDAGVSVLLNDDQVGGLG